MIDILVFRDFTGKIFRAQVSPKLSILINNYMSNGLCNISKTNTHFKNDFPSRLSFKLLTFFTKTNKYLRTIIRKLATTIKKILDPPLCTSYHSCKRFEINIIVCVLKLCVILMEYGPPLPSPPPRLSSSEHVYYRCISNKGRK